MAYYLVQQADTKLHFRGKLLRVRTQQGPRGGHKALYQAWDANPDWGYWYETATEAVKLSNPSDRVVR